MKNSFYIAFIILFLAAGCAAVPDAEKIIEQKENTATPAKVVTPYGPLSAAQSAEILKDIGATDMLRRHLAIEQSIAQSPLVTGNAARVVQDGPDTFRAIFTAIGSARRSVNLEFYIFEDIEHEGVTLSGLLLRKLKEGVAVNIIYDSFGSAKTPPEFFSRLKDAGAKVVAFNPMTPLTGKAPYSPLVRDHRKILVTDGSLAILGGINLSRTYQSSGSGRSGGTESKDDIFWHDTDVEIRGPVVAEVQRLFLEHWKQQKGPALDEAALLPAVPPAGSEVIRIIGSSTKEDIPRFYVTLLSAMRNATKNIWITNAYFVPTEEQMDDLKQAARRGVDVRLVLPDTSDSQTTLIMQRSRYGELLKAGVKIYEVRKQILHSKTVVIDGVWSVIGSSNFDHRSVVFNAEIDVVIIGEETGREMERLFEKDMAAATEITYKKWKKRPLFRKLKEKIVPLWVAGVKSNL
ncbi:MAG: phosphatidylserine/phosphatidylglycerophosphate/cardiolipin synthase family protein [Alphaproteobacteria bacterium]